MVASNNNIALLATEAPDTASFSINRAFRLDAAKGGYTYTGYAGLLVFSRGISAGFGGYNVTGYSTALTAAKVIRVDNGTYTVTGHAARLYESSFFYNDVEVIYVPAEVQRLTLDFENRQIAVLADEPVEELTEYRESVAEARMRTA